MTEGTKSFMFRAVDELLPWIFYVGTAKAAASTPNQLSSGNLFKTLVAEMLSGSMSAAKVGLEYQRFVYSLSGYAVLQSPEIGVVNSGGCKHHVGFWILYIIFKEKT